MAQPSASWKLKAISTLFSVHTIRVSARTVSSAMVGVDGYDLGQRALLFLEAIVFYDLGLE